MDYRIPESASEGEFVEEMNRRWVDKEELPTRIVGSRRALLKVMQWKSVATQYRSPPDDTPYGVGSHYVVLAYAKMQLAEAV